MDDQQPPKLAKVTIETDGHKSVYEGVVLSFALEIEHTDMAISQDDPGIASGLRQPAGARCK
jgi:hypothetical protein